MTDINNLPSPANEIVAYFLNEISNVEPKFVEGIYLTGSLAMKDFNPDKSDIDFLVLCNEFPSKEIELQLKNIHRSIQQRFGKPELNGQYFPIEKIEVDQPEHIQVLSLLEGTLRKVAFAMGPISLTELKSHALTLSGPEGATLKINVSPQRVNEFLYKNINSYWTKWIKQHASFFNRKILLLLFPRLTEWTILGIARQLCTLQTGKIVSKTVAGEYCLSQLPAKFHPIIREAIHIRKDHRTYPFLGSYIIKPSFSRLNETIKCGNFMIHVFNESYKQLCSNLLKENP